MKLHSIFPFLRWARPTAATLRDDIVAGITVGLVLVPQALAYATLAGMPPVTGLYAALLPSVVGILWGSSHLLAVGPVALTSLLTFAALQPLAIPGSAEWVALAAWLALYAGLMQFAIGALRLGIIANFVSNAVIAGFVNAAALIIIVSQLPAMLGLPPPGSGWFDAVGARLTEHPGLVASAATFGLGALLLLLIQRRLAPRLPGVLLVCIGGIAISAAIDFAARGAAVVGPVPGGLPSFSWPAALSLDQHRALLPAAVIIALISFTEAMASGRTLARRSRQRWDRNQEFIGQGLAKIASGVSGAFPVSGSFSRSALNAYVGARTGWSSLVAAACVLVSLLWFTDYLYHLPRAVLAALIIAPVLGLLDVAGLRRIWRASRQDGAIALATFAVTLLSAPYLHWGVLTGFTLSMFFFLYRRAHPRVVELGLDPSGTLRDRALHPLPPIAPDVLAVRLDASLAYIMAPVLEQFVKDRLADRPEVRIVLLCASAINDIDGTGIDLLRDLHRELAEQGISLRLSGVKKQVRDAMAHAGLLQELGMDSLFPNNRAAVAALTRPPDGGTP